MTTMEIITRALKELGADGLCNPDTGCSCHINELPVCDAPYWEWCVAARYTEKARSAYGDVNDHFVPLNSIYKHKQHWRDAMPYHPTREMIQQAINHVRYQRNKRIQDRLIFFLLTKKPFKNVLVRWVDSNLSAAKMYLNSAQLHALDAQMKKDIGLHGY